jgi:hypothetical protein
MACHVVENRDMMRFLFAAALLSTPLGLWSCAGTTEDDRSDEVIERAAFLFAHYGEAQKKQDAQMLSVLRGDLRKLN